MLIAVFTRPRHWTGYWHTHLQFAPSHPTRLVNLERGVAQGKRKSGYNFYFIRHREILEYVVVFTSTCLAMHLFFSHYSKKCPGVNIACETARILADMYRHCRRICYFQQRVKWQICTDIAEESATSNGGETGRYVPTLQKNLLPPTAGKLADMYRHYRRICYLQRRVNWQIRTDHSEEPERHQAILSIYQVTRRHIPEDDRL
jgi:hypothetical protein